MGTIRTIERLIEQRQAASRPVLEQGRVVSAYHDELLVTAEQMRQRPELLTIALDELVSEIAEARDAIQQEQAERRGLIGNADAIAARGPYRG